MKYVCPVCGYPNLESEPANHEICPSCGTQFGYDDYLRSYESLRNEWFAKGAKWFLEGYKPKNWNPYLQLLNLQSEVEFSSESLTVEKIGNLKRTERNITIEGSWNLIQSPSSVHITGV